MTAWQPKAPIVIAGYTLDPSEAWVRCFTEEWFRLAQGLGELERVGDMAIELVADNANRDPVQVAREQFEDEG